MLLSQEGVVSLQLTIHCMKGRSDFHEAGKEMPTIGMFVVGSVDSVTRESNAFKVEAVVTNFAVKTGMCNIHAGLDNEYVWLLYVLNSLTTKFLQFVHRRKHVTSPQQKSTGYAV
jgi:hypothetical protein